jgi:hypothetical protein
MNPKPHSSFENDAKVQEIIYYLRWSRRLFWGIVAIMVVNLILTYGLIFHPSRPSIETCAKYCPSIDATDQFSSELISVASKVLKQQARI